MQGKERVARTIAREPVDRPATWLGDPTTGALAKLCSHFGAVDQTEVKTALDDDLWQFDIPYHSPVGDHIATAFDFAKKGVDANGQSYEERTLTAPGYFEDATDVALVQEFPWPDPTLYIDRAELRARVAAIPSERATVAMCWSAHFQDSLSAFGMESALATMMLEPAMYRAVIDRITDFYLRANEVIYETVGDSLDYVLIGNDFGSQRGLMVAPEQLRAHVFAGTRALIEQAHAYDVGVIHHSCGSVVDILDDLIDARADAIHPIQARATGMEADRLAREFGSRVGFVGGVDAQYLLVEGSPEEVRTNVRELIDLFPTGLVVSPSHEALLPDVPVENVLAMFDATHQGVTA